MASRIIFTTVALLTMLLAWAVAPRPAEALLATHDCSFCHDFHGAISYSGLLKYSSTEVLCLSCHSTINGSTQAASVHNPLNLASNQLGYITCRECHNPHDNIGTNIKLVGYKYDPQNNRSFSAATIREELPTSDPGNPVYKPVAFASLTDFNRNDGTGACEICHASLNHASSIGTNCTNCHSHDSGFPKPSCTASGCHDGTGPGGRLVSSSSPHIGSFTCADCHTGHGAGTVIIPNNTAVGISYPNDTEHKGGISLGSTIATGTTEAEICWNCHAGLGISEWGANTEAATGSSPYNYGSLSGGIAPAWVNAAGSAGATWTSANFAYKTGAIQSTHAVDGSATAPGLDPVANIRCAYCHDVHDLNLASGDVTVGKPYLRGSWKGNPYREDGAPFAGETMITNGNFGAVPRGGTVATQLGGYQIDQNNNNPTSGWTSASSAGLCMLCHSKNKAGTAVTVNTMDWFGTNDWVGTNGHSNAVIGGTGTNAANIFREDWRKPNDGYCAPTSGTDVDGNAFNANSYCAGYPNMAYQQMRPNGNWAGGFRGAASLGAQGFWVEPTIGANQPLAYQGYNWGATVDASSTDLQYHKFSCSKCHNPHASRLPRLMITNCLDVRHNTWDDSPVTMTKEDTTRPITVTSNCGQGGTFNIEFIDVNGGLLYLPSTAFSASCSRAAYTITWDGTAYNYARGDLGNNVSVTIRGANYTFDTIPVSATDIQAWIGKGIPSKFSLNDAGLARISTDNSGRQITYGTSAQNCHRYVDVNGNGSTADAGDQRGWNKVTPW